MAVRLCSSSADSSIIRDWSPEEYKFANKSSFTKNWRKTEKAKFERWIKLFWRTTELSTRYTEVYSLQLADWITRECCRIQNHITTTTTTATKHPSKHADLEIVDDHVDDNLGNEIFRRFDDDIHVWLYQIANRCHLAFQRGVSATTIILRDESFGGESDDMLNWNMYSRWPPQRNLEGLRVWVGRGWRVTSSTRDEYRWPVFIIFLTFSIETKMIFVLKSQLKSPKKF